MWTMQLFCKPNQKNIKVSNYSNEHTNSICYMQDRMSASFLKDKILSNSRKLYIEQYFPTGEHEWFYLIKQDSIIFLTASQIQARFKILIKQYLNFQARSENDKTW